jgi:hypothetical protein
LKTLAASDGAPSAEPAPIIVCTSSMNRIRFGRSLISRITFWMRSSNMPRSIVPATIVFICRLTIWQSRRRTGTVSGANSMRRASPFGDRGLADARLAEQQDGIGALTVAQDLEDAIHFRVAAEHRRNLVLARQLVEVRGEVLEERRQLEALLQALLAELVVAHPRGRAGHERVGSMPWRRMIDTGMPCVSSKNGREEVGRFDRVRPQRLACSSASLNSSLVDGADAQVAARHARQQAQVLFEGLQDLVRIQLEVAHDLAEHVPFGLGEGQADVLVRQERVFPPRASSSARSTTRSAESASLFCGNVEVFHGALHALSLPGVTAIRGPSSGVDESRLTA